jgi:hypothetical protein
MPLLDLQRSAVEIGRVRIGDSKPDGRRPGRKLETFKLTTRSRRVADQVAALFGGEVKRYEPDRGQAGWQAITTLDALPVMVPPRGQMVTQWYEMWSKAGCARRCDSRHDQLNPEGSAAAPGNCRCPFLRDPDSGQPLLDDDGYRIPDGEERTRLSKLATPQACKPHTRISFIIPDLPGLGVWRFETTGKVVAGRIQDSADILQMAAQRGFYLPAELQLLWMEKRKPGEPVERFPVVDLIVLESLRAIANGDAAQHTIAAALPPPPSRKALTTGTSPAGPSGPAAIEAGDPMAAQKIANAAKDTTDRTVIQQLAEQAEAAGLGKDEVWVPDHNDPNTFTEVNILDYLRDRYRALSTPPTAPTPPTAKDTDR